MKSIFLKLVHVFFLGLLGWFIVAGVYSSAEAGVKGNEDFPGYCAVTALAVLIFSLSLLSAFVSDRGDESEYGQHIPDNVRRVLRGLRAACEAGTTCIEADVSRLRESGIFDGEDEDCTGRALAKLVAASALHDVLLSKSEPVLEWDDPRDR